MIPRELDKPARKSHFDFGKVAQEAEESEVDTSGLSVATNVTRSACQACQDTL